MSLLQAQRFNTNKPKWSLVDFKSLIPLVDVLEFGAKKYDVHQWKQGLNREEILESTYRHLIELMDNQELDEESKLHHTGHVMANMMFYGYHYRNNSFSEKRNSPIK